MEKQLNLNGKKAIEAFGVEEFNRLCRKSVFTYKADWEELSNRIGYWLDYEHAYVTYTNEYIESVWWLLQRLFEKNLLSRGHRVLAVLSPLRHRALEPRAFAGVRQDQGSVDLRHLSSGG